MAASSRKRGRPSENKSNTVSHKAVTKENGEASVDDELSTFFAESQPDLEDGGDADNEDVDSTDSEAEESEESEFSGLSEDDDDEDSDGSESSDDNQSANGEQAGGSGTSSEKTGPAAPKINEYEYDSSDEEDLRNTVGNVPMEWYRDYPHMGYDLSGKKIMKPKTGDELDNLIEQSENPDYWRTVRDPQTGQNIVLSREDCEVIARLKSGKYADSDVQPFLDDWPSAFEKEIEIHPLSNRPEDKRSFIPSKWERLKVGKMVHSMKMGWMKTPTERSAEIADKQKDEQICYDIWSNEDENDRFRLKMHIPAPKMVLPGHAESYNPPAEYLFSKEELEKWTDTEKEDRRQNFVPQKFSSMRTIPAYRNYMNERFARCLDLYLCPRQQKMRMNVNPEDLIPKLPQPKDLQPFPTTESIVFTGHNDLVRKISLDPSGQWMISGSDDKTAKLWEVQTGRCMKTLTFTDKVKSVAWCPNSSISLAAIATGNSVVLINPQLGDKLILGRTDELIAENENAEATSGSAADWKVCDDIESEEFTEQLRRLTITHSKPVAQVTWHVKGDYFAVTLNDAGNQSVIIHQISKRRSQCPFSKPKGLVQCTLFHPNKPFLFVATQRYIRVYNLLKQELSRKLQANCKWISSMAIHPGGDNVITGSYDCRLHWFDMDLSTKPYQTLKHQKKAIRSVDIHKKYPLFASTSDEGSVVVCHGMVYNDLMQNPLIVPVKVLRGHKTTNGLSAIDCQFHPTQPWLLTSGADSTIRLYS